MGKPSKKTKTEVPKKKEGSEPPKLEKTTLEQIKPSISNSLSKEIEKGDETPNEKAMAKGDETPNEKPMAKDEMPAPIAIPPKDTTGNNSKQGNHDL